jgi:hypothetical protein
VTLQLLYKVVEHYPDDAPAVFGGEVFDVATLPAAGQIITLHWLSGRPAYDVRVFRIDEDCTLHAEALPTFQA